MLSPEASNNFDWVAVERHAEWPWIKAFGLLTELQLLPLSVASGKDSDPLVGMPSSSSANSSMCASATDSRS